MEIFKNNNLFIKGDPEVGKSLVGLANSLMFKNKLLFDKYPHFKRSIKLEDGSTITSQKLPNGIYIILIDAVPNIPEVIDDQYMFCYSIQYEDPITSVIDFINIDMRFNRSSNSIAFREVSRLDARFLNVGYRRYLNGLSNQTADPSNFGFFGQTDIADLGQLGAYSGIPDKIKLTGSSHPFEPYRYYPNYSKDSFTFKDRSEVFIADSSRIDFKGIVSTFSYNNKTLSMEIFANTDEAEYRYYLYNKEGTSTFLGSISVDDIFPGQPDKYIRGISTNVSWNSTGTSCVFLLEVKTFSSNPFEYFCISVNVDIALDSNGEPSSITPVYTVYDMHIQGNFETEEKAYFQADVFIPAELYVSRKTLTPQIITSIDLPIAIGFLPDDTLNTVWVNYKFTYTEDDLHTKHVEGPYPSPPNNSDTWAIKPDSAEGTSTRSREIRVFSDNGNIDYTGITTTTESYTLNTNPTTGTCLKTTTYTGIEEIFAIYPELDIMFYKNLESSKEANQSGTTQQDLEDVYINDSRIPFIKGSFEIDNTDPATCTFPTLTGESGYKIEPTVKTSTVIYPVSVYFTDYEVVLKHFITQYFLPDLGYNTLTALDFSNAFDYDENIFIVDMKRDPVEAIDSITGGPIDTFKLYPVIIKLPEGEPYLTMSGITLQPSDFIEVDLQKQLDSVLKNKTATRIVISFDREINNVANIPLIRALR